MVEKWRHRQRRLPPGLDFLSMLGDTPGPLKQALKLIF